MTGKAETGDSNKEKNKGPAGINRNLIVIAAAALAVAAVGGYALTQKKDSNTVSMNVGGKEISATFGE